MLTARFDSMSRGYTQGLGRARRNQMRYEYHRSGGGILKKAHNETTKCEQGSIFSGAQEKLDKQGLRVL